MYDSTGFYWIQYFCEWNVYGIVQWYRFGSVGILKIFCVYVDYYDYTASYTGGKRDMDGNAYCGVDGAYSVCVHIFQV